MQSSEERILELERLLDAEKQKNRVLQVIRNNYEQKYGVRIFANGSEQDLKEEEK